MDIDEARAFFRTAPIDERPAGTWDDHAWDRAFDEASSSVQERYRDAMVTFVDAGTKEELEVARGFFWAHRTGAREAARLVALYVERGWDAQHSLATTVASAGHQIGAPERAALVRVFIADPLKHYVLAGVALMDGKTGPAWEAFATLVRATNDVAVLHEAFNATVRTSAEEEFFALVREKPASLQYALAKTLSDSGDELLRNCGLQPPRRFDREEVVARLASGRECLVRPSLGGPEPGQRFALYVDGSRVMEVFYDPGAGRVRELNLRPAGELARAVAARTTVQVVEDQLAPRDALDAPFLAAVAAREVREREVRRELADPARWIAFRSDWSGMAGRLRHSPALGWHNLGIEDGRPARARLYSDDVMPFFFNILLYSYDRGVEPIPPGVFARIRAAEPEFVGARQRLQAGTLAVRDDTCIPSSIVALARGGLWRVSLDRGAITGLGERLNENWEHMLFDGLLGAALRGELAERLIPLAAQ